VKINETRHGSVKYRDYVTAERLRELLTYDPKTGFFSWRVSRGSAKEKSEAGRKNSHGYIEISIDSRFYKAHRLAWMHVYGEWPVEQLDHINGIRTDNRLANLREATNAQNGQNQAMYSHNTSGHPGVSWCRTYGKWKAKIHAAGKLHHLGYFHKVEDAVAARAKAKSELHTFQPFDRGTTP